MQPTSTSSSWPYSVIIWPKPVVAAVTDTKPKMPMGARRIIQVTMADTACDKSSKSWWVAGDARRRAMPSRIAHIKMPM